MIKIEKAKNPGERRMDLISDILKKRHVSSISKFLMLVMNILEVWAIDKTVQSIVIGKAIETSRQNKQYVFKSILNPY